MFGGCSEVGDAIGLAGFEQGVRGLEKLVDHFDGDARGSGERAGGGGVLGATTVIGDDGVGESASLDDSSGICDKDGKAAGGGIARTMRSDRLCVSWKLQLSLSDRGGTRSGRDCAIEVGPVQNGIEEGRPCDRRATEEETAPLLQMPIQ